MQFPFPTSDRGKDSIVSIARITLLSKAIAPTPATETQYLRSHPSAKMRSLNFTVFDRCIGAESMGYLLIAKYLED